MAEINPQKQSIADQLYYEKLGIIIIRLSKWQQEKSQKIDEIYLNQIGATLQQLEKNDQDLRAETNALLSLVSSQCSFLDRLRKEEPMANQLKMPQIFADFSQEIGIVRKSMLQLSHFLGCLFGAIATEFGEIKQFYGKAAEIKLKLINFRSKRETEENSIKESIFAKRVRKQFELSKTKLLRKGLPIQLQFYTLMANQVREYFHKQAVIHLKFYANLATNLDQLRVLQEQCFGKSSLNKLVEYYSAKMSQLKGRILSNQRQEKQNQQKSNGKDEREQVFLGLAQSQKTLVSNFLQQITIAQWKMQIRKSLSEGKDLHKNAFVELMGHLTLDKKLLLVYEQEVQMEIYLEEAKVEDGSEDGVVIIKDKKTKENYQVKFQCLERLDEFYLHLETLIGY